MYIHPTGGEADLNLTKDIKDFALDIGYSHVGITSSEDFTDFIDEVESRGSIYDFYVENQRKFLSGAQPKKCMPEAEIHYFGCMGLRAERVP